MELKHRPCPSYCGFTGLHLKVSLEVYNIVACQRVVSPVNPLAYTSKRRLPVQVLPPPIPLLVYTFRLIEIYTCMSRQQQDLVYALGEGVPKLVYAFLMWKPVDLLETPPSGTRQYYKLPMILGYNSPFPCVFLWQYYVYFHCLIRVPREQEKSFWYKPNDFCTSMR